MALVGSRAATEYGLRAAGDLADGLVARGFTVVSGAAYGIDAAAHRAALAGEGRTVAVLACGADRAYPTAHRGLIDAVARAGAVVSESPPAAAPYRWRFLARNRIIAALSGATVVVEASLRSGSLSTAKEAREHHLPVGAVPGPVTSATSAGCHALVRDTGAVLVTDAAEAAELAAPIGSDLAPSRDRGPSRPEDHLDDTAYRVWSVVPVRGSATTERVGCRVRGPGGVAGGRARGPRGRRTGRPRRGEVAQATEASVTRVHGVAGLVGPVCPVRRVSDAVRSGSVAARVRIRARNRRVVRKSLRRARWGDTVCA